MNSDIKIQLCRDDFYFMMRNAIIQSGGMDNLSKWKTMKLEELVGLFAQNGIRMVHMPEKHMDAIKILWENPKQSKLEPFVKREDVPLPKKRQLLFDQVNSLDEDENDRKPEY